MKRKRNRISTRFCNANDTKCVRSIWDNDLYGSSLWEESETQMIRSFDFVKAIHGQGNAPLFGKSLSYWHLHHACANLGPDPSGTTCNSGWMSHANVSKVARKVNASIFHLRNMRRRITYRPW